MLKRLKKWKKQKRKKEGKKNKGKEDEDPTALMFWNVRSEGQNQKGFLDEPGPRSQGIRGTRNLVYVKYLESS